MAPEYKLNINALNRITELLGTGGAAADHTQYLVVSGTRQLTGDWDFGPQTISGTGDICAPSVFSSYVYVKGDEDTEGSIRFTVDTDTGIAVIQEKKDKIWQPASLELGPGTLWIGKIGVAEVGHHMATEAPDGHVHLHSYSEFDGEVSTKDLAVPYALNFTERVVLQPDESATWSGTTFNTIIQNPTHSLQKKGYFKTHTTAASQPVRIQVWEGTDDTGTEVFDQTYPTNLFSASTEVEIITKGYLEFKATTNYFMRINSSENFSLKTNSGGQAPWFAVDVSALVEDNILQTTEWVDGATYTEEDYFIDSRKIYICNTTGVQTGTFASNSDKWGVVGTSGAESDPVFTVWDKSTGISITENQISDLDHFTTEDETDPVFIAWDKDVADMTGIEQNRIAYGTATGGLQGSAGLIYDGSDLTVGNDKLFVDVSNGSTNIGKAVTGTDAFNVFAPTTGVQTGIASFYDSSSNIKFRIRDEWTASSFPPRIESESSLGFAFNTTTDSKYIWYINGTGNEKMRLTSTGLGIGTDPTTTLDVNGNVDISGDLTVGGTLDVSNGWSGDIPTVSGTITVLNGIITNYVGG